MKNKNIKRKITKKFSEITMAESPSGTVLERIQQNINIPDLAARSKRPKKFMLKPVLAAVMCVTLITTAVASAPLILKMIGSDIEFFGNEEQIRYSADQELIRQYGSEVGVTAEKDGFSLTVDNIAFDGTFMNVFYTIKSGEVNLYEETKEHMGKYGRLNSGERFIVQDAIAINDITFELPGHELIHNENILVTSDGYFVTDYELKAVQRYIITDDLPDIFDINIIYNQYSNRLALRQTLANDDGTYEELVPININLTVDMSESKAERLAVNPDLSAEVTQARVNVWSEYENEISDVIAHNITIDRVSISPLGNILVFTEAGSVNYENRELFSNYFITDDKGNFYGKISSHGETRKNPEEDETLMVEFYGNVPSDAQYLKVIPYNRSGGSGYSEMKLINLPQKLKESEYGNVIIESCTVTDEEIILNYKYDGMVSFLIRPVMTVAEGEEALVNKRGYSSTLPVYNRRTDSYTYVFTFAEPLKNAEDIVTGIEIPQLDVELLEDQAIIIPLK